MIPRANIIEWRESGYSWQADAMVEQDLIISRILVELFDNENIRDNLIFRGGTALHKLCFKTPMRYSEDIDLVQRTTSPIGPFFDSIRECLESWLGNPQRKQGPGVATMTFRIESEESPPQPLKIKLEINTREHFHILPIRNVPFKVACRWFAGAAVIPMYEIEELLATKLRALYQRRKGRDLFDLAAAIRTQAVNTQKIVTIFERYMKAEGHSISKRDFQINLLNKMKHPGFQSDCNPLLRPGTVLDLRADMDLIEKEILCYLPDP